MAIYGCFWNDFWYQPFIDMTKSLKLGLFCSHIEGCIWPIDHLICAACLNKDSSLRSKVEIYCSWSPIKLLNRGEATLRVGVEMELSMTVVWDLVAAAHVRTSGICECKQHRMLFATTYMNVSTDFNFIFSWLHNSQSKPFTTSLIAAIDPTKLMTSLKWNAMVG